MMTFLSGVALLVSNRSETSCLHTSPLVKFFILFLCRYRCRSQLSLRRVFSLVGRFVHRSRIIPAMFVDSMCFRVFHNILSVSRSILQRGTDKHVRAMIGYIILLFVYVQLISDCSYKNVRTRYVHCIFFPSRQQSPDRNVGLETSVGQGVLL